MLRIVTILMLALSGMAAEISFRNCTLSNVFLTMPNGEILVLGANSPDLKFPAVYVPSFYWEGMTPVALDLTNATNYSSCQILFGVQGGDLVAAVYEYRSNWEWGLQGIYWAVGLAAVWICIMLVRRVFGSGYTEL